MRYHALALDYDGTVAHHGGVADSTLQALKRAKASGRKLILVTGRELHDLQRVFPQWEIFDRIVAENGGLLFRPATREEKALGPSPPGALIEALKRRKVEPLSQGRVIVATWEPHQEAVLEAIHEAGLEYQVIFNKGAVMILPSGLNKATGMAEALDDLGLSPRNVVAAGDAENDNAMLEAAECAVAVANALPSLKAKADLVTEKANGEGVEELIGRVLRDDLADVAKVRERHGLVLGEQPDGKIAILDPYARGALLSGISGGGKTTFATAFVENLREAGYQFCLFDPEGDYAALDGVISLGDPRHPPIADEVLQILENPRESVVVSTLAVPFQDRPEFFRSLFPGLLELRSRTGRPHWIIVDEAHHLVPTTRVPALLNLPREMRGLFLISVHPARVSRALLEQVDWVLAVGEGADASLRQFAATAGLPSPEAPSGTLAPGEALAWRHAGSEQPFHLRGRFPRTERRRHLRKYSEGELGPDKSFHFRGQDNRLNLRAHNLMLFLQMADGVDDATWEFHLRRGDYSQWFRRDIKDPALADEAREVEVRQDLSPVDSRAAIRGAVEKRYTGPV